MILIATNDRNSLDNVQRWRNEIEMIEQEKPIILILTKSDLAEGIDEPVTFEEVEEKFHEDGFQGAYKTSSKEWD